VKRWLKAALGALLFHSGLYRRRLRGRAVIVLFHRVDDRLRGNPISCTRAEFRAYTAFFKRFFTVVPLKELLDRLAAGRDVSRLLVITFDDGYRDNHDAAAPRLAELRLPACFFIATGFIGSSRVPWWDEESGIQPEWMGWDEVRGLARSGFEIGAHTVNHVDLGRLHGDAAQLEINGSRSELESQLGEPVRYFSYPYGRADQITEANREVVRSAGFDCCLSAFGGDVAPGWDPYRLRRTPISPWYVSPYQFGFELWRGDQTPAPAAGVS
jgi:peptidoglycan/xylan/chitin deacetylase (PgdA/CDA1 family)